MFDRQHAWSFPAQECVAVSFLCVAWAGLERAFLMAPVWNSDARVEENAAAVAELGVRGWKWNGSGRQHSAAGHMAMRRTGGLRSF
jgi:hypothetical protein